MTCCCDRTVIHSEKAAQPIGPYSIGVQAGHLVFTSGQIGIDPQTQTIVAGGVEAETRQVMLNLQTILQAAGTDLSRVVKTTIFLRDMNDFVQVNAVYGEFFTSEPPARSTVQVAALPKNVAVEIEAIAVVPCSGHDCDCDCKCD